MILGISEAPQNVSFAAMARAAAGAGASDPAGPGGREPVVVHRRRRHEHDLEQRAHPDQPQAAATSARSSATDDHRAACSRSWRRSTGITLYMQPVQDLTVEDRVSRTQYQYTLEDPNADELAQWAPKLVEQAARRCPSCATWRATSRTTGCERTLVDRPRHRLAPGHHAADDRRHALRRVRPAPGLDHLHAAEPVPRGPRGDAGVPARTRTRSTNIYVRIDHGRRRCRSARSRTFERGDRRRWRSTTRASSPSVTLSFNLAPGVSLGDAVDGDRRRATQELGMPAEHPRRRSRARRRRSSASLANEPLLILAALVTVYIVLGVLYESYIHPITILSTLPSAGVGALLALMICGTDLERHRAHRHHPADRHREEERDHDDRLRARGRARGGQAAARGDLPGLPAALPADHDDHDGGAARRPAARARHAASAPSCAARSASRSSAA